MGHNTYRILKRFFRWGDTSKVYISESIFPSYKKSKILEFYERENKNSSKELMTKVDFIVVIAKIPYSILEKCARYE